MFQLATMQLVGEKGIDRIMKIDLPHLSTKAEVFLKSNRGSYYLVVNTWLMIIKQYSTYGWITIADHIKTNGLISAITEAQDASDSIIQEGVVSTDNPFHEVIHDIRQLSVVSPHNVRYETNVGQDWRATVLQVLRYPKRLSLLHTDLIEKKSLLGFLQVENRLKVGLENNKYIPTYHLSRMKDLAWELFDWDSIIKVVEEVIKDPFAFSLPINSTLDAGRNSLKKLTRISEEYPEWFKDPFDIPYIGLHVSRWSSKVRYSKVTTVPKTYKAARVIAPEPVSRQAKGRAIANAISRFLPDNIPLRDQSVNQEKAFEGSIGGGYATVDQSNASDTHTSSLFRSIFPLRFVELVTPYLPEFCFYTDSKGNLKFKPLQMLTTAGNALTFILESMFFYIVDCYASRMFSLFTESSTLEPFVYGDDQAVDERVVPTLFDIMESIGLMPNMEKSFFSGHFRESCGKEYYDGIDISSVYYPRRVLKCGFEHMKPVFSHAASYDQYSEKWEDTLSSLISLQRRLFGPCYEASRFVAEFIKAGEPRMTESIPCPENRDRLDLSSYRDTFGPIKAPSVEGDISLPPEILSTRHTWLQPVVQWKFNSTGVTDYQVRLFNAWKYQEFLKNGPRYDDPILEMQGISTPPLSIREFAGTPTVKWRFKN